MMKKMQVLKFENNQIEKKKVDSVKTNLDNLIKHIEVISCFHFFEVILHSVVLVLSIEISCGSIVMLKFVLIKNFFYAGIGKET